MICGLRTRPDIFNRMCNQAACVFCRLGGFCRKTAHFFCHNRKALPCNTRARRFRGSIQCQELRLKSDILHRFRNRHNLRGRTVNIFRCCHQLFHLGICLGSVASHFINQFRCAAAAHRAVLYLRSDCRNIRYQPINRRRLLHSALRKSLCARGNLVRTDIDLFCDNGNIADNAHKVCMDRFQAFQKYLKIADIIRFIFRNIDRQVAVCNLAQNTPHIINGFLQTAADMVGRLRNHANLVPPAAKTLQLFIRRKVQISQMPDGAFHSHQFLSLSTESGA